METIEKSIEVKAPIRAVYNLCSQFEEFPHFMEGVEQVQQIDNKRLRWKATIAGKTKEWDSEIVEQTPDKIVAWRSTSGTEMNEPAGADTGFDWSWLGLLGLLGLFGLRGAACHETEYRAPRTA